MENYRILERIGEGAHGVVLKALCVESGEAVALKKISIRLIDHQIPHAIMREIQALQQLDHENVLFLDRTTYFLI